MISRFMFIYRVFIRLTFSLFLLMQVVPVYAASPVKTEKIKVYQLMYREKESGLDPYRVRMLISKRYIRIDEMDDKSGYIIYDNKQKAIYSVSHYDKRILVIKPNNLSVRSPGLNIKIEYGKLDKAPPVSGRPVFNYKILATIQTGKVKKQKTCADYQLVEGLLPKVTRMLKDYQQVLSAQQVQMLKRTIKGVQTPCYLADQIYDKGLYYDKGLPVQEWHSNKKSKILLDYKQVKVNPDIFNLPKSYSRFSIPQ